MFDSKSTRSLHLELTTICNAKCLACVRSYDINSIVEEPLPITSLPLEKIETIINEIGSLDIVLLCGTFGDPFGHPKIKDIIELISKKLPETLIFVHTNGSLGSEDTWKELGANHNGNLVIYFSIDGLADTLPIYRVGVSFEKVIENAKAFIENGGKAHWKFVKFNHNEHQIDECRSLSKELGFEGFEVRSNHTPKVIPGVTKLENLIEDKIKVDRHKDLSNEELDGYFSEKYPGTYEIDCKAKKGSELYIDAFGGVWPCCWHGSNGAKRRSSFEREYFYRNLTLKYGVNFNSLHHHGLNDILNGPYFSKDLLESFKDQQIGNPCMPSCKQECGSRVTI
jgi:MoaA/NifB/PqqE/SkfB family radical SAM enzyme